jgi:pimeloyl-ACP methyl ester carboxylesterase
MTVNFKCPTLSTSEDVSLETPKKTKELVVLIHGLGGTRIDMLPIARKLKKSGFQTRRWGYRSLGNRIETHANRLGIFLKKMESEQPRRKIHLVTHSMGGIITRTMLSQFQLDNIDRVVMLAPPHQGSHAARKLSPFFGWLTPSLKQLSDEPDSFVRNLPNPFENNQFDFGIVEAEKDRVIEQGSVLLDGYRDYAEVCGHHGILTWYSNTIQLVDNFLNHGRFNLTTVDSHSERQHPINAV